MIDFVRGTAVNASLEAVIVENGGIGYKILTSSNTLSKIEVGSEVEMFTEMIVREDSISLCGFISKDELDVFKLLTSVNGIGTKVSLGVLSGINYKNVINMIVTGDSVGLTTAPGIGKKTAQRMVLELKDKISNNISFAELDILSANSELMPDAKSIKEASEGLVSLGYRKTDVEKLLKAVNGSYSTEELIKIGLRHFATI